MQSPLRDATQTPPTVVPRQQAAHLSDSEKSTVSGKAAMAVIQPLSPPKDVVTLSSSRDGSSSKRKASQPVSSDEKQALLESNSPRDSFSVYG
jgi:hypothetical protein